MCVWMGVYVCVREREKRERVCRWIVVGERVWVSGCGRAGVGEWWVRACTCGCTLTHAVWFRNFSFRVLVFVRGGNACVHAFVCGWHVKRSFLMSLTLVFSS